MPTCQFSKSSIPTPPSKNNKTSLFLLNLPLGLQLAPQMLRKLTVRVFIIPILLPDIDVCLILLPDIPVIRGKLFKLIVLFQQVDVDILLILRHGSSDLL